VAGFLTWLQLSDIGRAVAGGGDLSAYDLISSATGPLSMLLLVEASMVKSCMSAAGGGIIGRCWNSFVAAIFLTALSNLGIWLDGHGLLPPAPGTMTCFIAFLAATGYALGPAWQIVAVQ